MRQKQMKIRVVYSAVGAGLLAWGGTGISARMGLTGLAEINLVVFAVGLVCMAYAPVVALEGRVHELEAQLTGRNATIATPASSPRI